MERYLIGKTITAFFVITTIVYGSDLGGEIYRKNCVQCHVEKTTELTDNLSLKAPPIDALTRQIKYYYRNKEKFVQYVVDFLSQPDTEKSVCKPCIKRWGLMPPVNIPEEEKQSVALWMFRNFK